MLKCVEKIKVLAEKMGASLDEEHLFGCDEIIVDARPGYIWCSNRCTTIVVAASCLGGGQTWWIEACRDAEFSIRMGMDKCEENEITKLEYERDEPWRAPKDFPSHISA